MRDNPSAGRQSWHYSARLMIVTVKLHYRAGIERGTVHQRGLEEVNQTTPTSVASPACLNSELGHLRGITRRGTRTGASYGSVHFKYAHSCNG